MANSTKSSLQLIMLGILAIQVSLVIAFYNSITMGLPTLSQLWLGLNLVVFATFLSVYQFGLKKRKFILFQFR